MGANIKKTFQISIPDVKLTVCILIFFNVYLFLRKKDRVQVGEEQRERHTHRIQNRLQALSCQHGARHRLELMNREIIT